MEQQLDTIRLLILDDHQLFREAWCGCSKSDPDVAISGQASTVTDALRLLQDGPIELVLLDWDLGAERGSRFLTEASAQGWDGRVLVVTGGVTTREAAELIGYGVHGIFLKSGSPESLLEAIRLVGRGETFFLEEHATSRPPRLLQPDQSRCPRERRRSCARLWKGSPIRRSAASSTSPRVL